MAIPAQGRDDNVQNKMAIPARWREGHIKKAPHNGRPNGFNIKI